MKYISATVNEIYSDDKEEGIEELDEGNQVMLSELQSQLELIKEELRRNNGHNRGAGERCHMHNCKKRVSAHTNLCLTHLAIREGYKK